MPGTKRATKSVSYAEHNDDDDDFITSADRNKKNRPNLTKDIPNETKPSTRQPPRKRKDKLSKAEEEELELALKLSKETAVIPLEKAMPPDELKQNSARESTVSSHESNTTIETETDEQDENSLPKTKRLKREENNDDDNDDEHNNEEIDQDESSDDEELEEDDVEDVDDTIDEEKEDETVVIPKKIEPTKTETKKNLDASTVKSIDVNSNRSVTRAQQKPTVSAPEVIKKKSNVPVGFPTTKIVIPTSQASRVGLSRKSGGIKSLHPNLNPRVVHE